MAVELYKHNKIAYEKVLEHLKKSNRTCVIHPTGSGKSFISLKWLYDNRDKKCLFMCPTDAIKNQLLEHIKNEGLDKEKDFPNLDIVLYQSVQNIKDNHYDNIVFDEFHRIGAKTWGEGVKDLLSNNPNAKVLGLTATPIRYLDNNKNMAEKIFNNDIASQMSLADAIVEGILPPPIYINAIYEYEDKIDHIYRKIKDLKDPDEKEELMQRLDDIKDQINRSEGIQGIFGKYMNPHGRYIVFCKDMKHLLDVMDELPEMLVKVNKKLTTSYVSSKKSKVTNEDIIRNFEENNDDSLKLLFSIEMLNEGLHVNNINGVIMFRETKSTIVYLQQLGRALSVGHSQNPTIFDVVNNCENIGIIKDIRNEVKSKGGGVERPRPQIDDILRKFRIVDDQKDINELLEKLEKDAELSWDDWFDLAKAYFEVHGNLNIPISYRTLDGKTEIKSDDERYKDAIHLGEWIGTQRGEYKKENYGTLTEGRIQKLESIGMIWNTIEAKWNKNYELAKAYYEEHGNLNISQNYRTLDGKTKIEPKDPRYKDAIHLGKWLTRQRQEYKKDNHGILTEERIQKLESIGMIWNTIEVKWNENYELAKAYYEKHGNLNIPRNYKTLDGKTEIKSEDPKYKDAIKLGGWIQWQRTNYKNGKLSSEQIQKLESIGMIWDPLETAWNENYELAKAYYEIYGNLNISKNYRTYDGKTEIKSEDPRYKDAIKLGGWISTQRIAYKNGKLDPEKIQKLESIGMIWNTKKNKDEMKLLIDKFHIKHKADIQKLPYKVVLLKINFLISNNLPIEDENGLNKIFFMSNLDMREEYGISLEELMGHTKEKER